MADKPNTHPIPEQPDIDSPWTTEGGSHGGGGPHLWQVNWVRDLLFIALIFFFIWFGYYLRGIFTPILIALFLAYLFHPIITAFETRWKVPRPVTITGLIGCIFIVVAGFGFWLGPIAWNETADQIDQLPAYLQSLADKAEERFNIDTAQLTETVNTKVEEFRADPAGSASQLLGYAFAGTGKVASVIESLIGTTVYVAFMLILIPFYFFFFAWQFGPLTRSLDDYLPVKRKARIQEILGMMDRAVSAYFRDRVLIAVIMAVLFCTGWWFCGVPYALLLGIAAGVFSLIPYVGGVFWPLALLLMYLKVTTGEDAPGFDWMTVLLWPSLVFWVIQFLEGWVLTPWIQGKSMEMSAITILIVVFIGGAIGGLYGLILCIPIAACIKILLKEIALPKLAEWAKDN